MSICDSIKRKYIRLSKGQRKVAQYVLDNPAVVASHVAVEVGRLAGVSESTVIRFCYAMDLAGFSDLQDKMKEYLQQSGTPLNSSIVVKKQLKNKSTNIEQAVESMQHLAQFISQQQLEQCAELLSNTQEIHILSFIQSTPTATWLYEKLKSFRQNVHLHRYSNILTNESIVHVEHQAALVLFIESEQTEAVEKMLNALKGTTIQVMAIAYDEKWENYFNFTQFMALKNSDVESDIAVITLLESILTLAKTNACTNSDTSLVDQFATV